MEDVNKRITKVARQPASEPDVQQIPKVYNETVIVEEGATRIQTETIGNSWIVGSSTNGIVGTNTGTQNGSQQVVGGAGRVTTLAGVVNPENRFIDRFNFDDYIDTGNTTATVDTSTDYQIEFTDAEVAQSEVIAYQDGTTIRRANLTAETNGAGSLAFQMSADNGSNWENVTSGNEHTFTNTGEKLLWKATATDTINLTKIQIIYR